jgi:hypothetical protein
MRDQYLKTVTTTTVASVRTAAARIVWLRLELITSGTSEREPLLSQEGAV